MFLIFLVYAVALTLETLGSYLSVVGLAAKTGPVLIMIAITLDCSKIIIASVLYKRWRTVHLAFKLFFVPVLICLVLFTSTGTVGFLTKQLGNSNAYSEQQKTQIDSLQTEKDKLEERKATIDNQITQLPATSVTARKRLTDLFAGEMNDINSRLSTINKQLADNQSKTVETRNENGTMASIASAWNISPDAVIKIVALVLAIFIDPLAIALLSLANFLSEERKKDIAKQASTIKINPWDAFRKTFFKNKYQEKLLKNNHIKPYTDSSGHLMKETSTLSSYHFITDVKLTQPTIKPLNFTQQKLSDLFSLKDFIQPEPVLIKNTTHLTPKRIIQKSSFFTPVVEKLLNKLDDIVLPTQSILQEKSLPKNIEKDSIHLSAHTIFTQVDVVEPLPIFLKATEKTELIVSELLTQVKESHLNKDIIQLQPLNSIHNIDPIELNKVSEDDTEHAYSIGGFNLDDLTITDISHLPQPAKKMPKDDESFYEDEHQFEDSLVAPISIPTQEEPENAPLVVVAPNKPATSKPRPETLASFSSQYQHNKGGFFEKGEPVKYIPSNFPEDIYAQSDYDYDSAIVYWDNDDDNFDLELREVVPIEIKGFHTESLLLENQF